MSKEPKEVIKFFATMIFILLLPLLFMPLAKILLIKPKDDIDQFFFGVFLFFCLILISLILIIIFISIMFKKAKSKPLRAFFDNVWLHLACIILVSILLLLIPVYKNPFILSYIYKYTLLIYAIISFLVLVFSIFVKDLKKIIIFIFLIFILFKFIPTMLYCFANELGFIPCLILIPCVLISSTVLLCHFFKFIKSKLINCIKK